jgi:hypothetical protein
LIDEELSVTRYLPANLLVMGEGTAQTAKGKAESGVQEQKATSEPLVRVSKTIRG